MRLKNVWEQAQNSFFFEVDVLRKQHNLSDPDEKTKFVHGMARKLLVFEDKVQRDSYLEALSAKYSVPKEDLRFRTIRGRQDGAGRLSGGHGRTT